jgi:hypothetical protein
MEYIHQKLGHALGLKQTPSQAGLGSDEKGPAVLLDVPRVRVAGRLCHVQGLKPGFYSILDGTTKVVP